MKPSCSDMGCNNNEYKFYNRTWINYCPICKGNGTLTINPKNTHEGELTCGDGLPPFSMNGKGCDADYCGVTGNAKETFQVHKYKLEEV